MTLAATDLRLRPYAGPEDVVEIVRIVNAGNRADGVDERWTAPGLYEAAGFVVHDRSVAMRRPLIVGSGFARRD